MPTIGFGTAGLSIGTADAVLAALDAGYRSGLLPAAGDVATVYLFFHFLNRFLLKLIHSAGCQEMCRHIDSAGAREWYREDLVGKVWKCVSIDSLVVK